MVNQLKVAVLAIAVSGAVQASEEMTYREYQKAIGSGQERLDYSKQLLGHDKLHTLLPSGTPTIGDAAGHGAAEKDSNNNQDGPAGSADAKAGVPEAPKSPGRGEHNSEATQTSQADLDAERRAQARRDRLARQKAAEAAAAKSAAADKRKREPRPVYMYISPSLQAGAAGIRNQSVVKQYDGERVIYGISIGTQISVTLDSSASNVQPGYIQLRVNQPVRGRKATLPVGSKLFARSSAVIGSEKLFLNISKGVTPSGKEFTARGVVFDSQGDPGLAARVLSDGKSLARAGSEGINSFGKGLINSVTGETLAGNAANAAASQLLTEKERGDQRRQGEPAYVVQAYPQDGSVQIEATF